MPSEKLLVAPASLTRNMSVAEVAATNAFGEITPQVLEWHNKCLERLATELKTTIDVTIEEQSYV